VQDGLLTTILEWVNSFMLFFRAAWITTIVLGVALAAIAFILKRNPDRRKSPWIVGGIGLLMVISSGTQLLFSLWR